MNRFTTLILTILLSGFMTLSAADKKPLDHTVYDMWESIKQESISNDGKWVIYSQEPQEGDANLYIRNLENDSDTIFPRGTEPKLTQDSKYAVFKIKPFFKDTRQAKIDKKKKDDMPKDSLGIYSLYDKELVKIGLVKSFKTPEKGYGWIAYQLEKEKPVKDTTKTKEEEKAEKKDRLDAENGKDDSKNDKGTTLVIRRLNDGHEYKIDLVTDYLFSKDGKKLIYACAGNDSTEKAGVFVFNTADTTKLALVSAKKGSFKQIVWDDNSQQAAFVADIDTSKDKQRFFSLYYWDGKNKPATVIADTLTKGLPEHWLISENGKITFSKDGKKLFFGTAPIPAPEDTTIVDFEVAKVDIWNWKDPLLQPQQLKQLKKELQRSYMAVIHLKNKNFIQLADENMPNIRLTSERNADLALGTSSLPYQQFLSWEGALYDDVYLVNLKDGSKTLVKKKHRGPVNISPAAKYIYMFDEIEGDWLTWSTKKGFLNNLTKDIKVSFNNELDDHPDYARSHGAMAWSKDDKEFYVYDRFDAWQLNPEGIKAPVNWTNGIGRKTNTTYRYVRIDKEERFLTPNQDMLFKTLNQDDYTEGFVYTTCTENAKKEQLVQMDYHFTNPKKAENSDTFLFTKSTFQEFPDLWTSDTHFNNMKKISAANQQQKDYLWGTVELVNWVSANGDSLKGLLYKPENFDPNKKYPMIVYFYEKTSFIKNWYMGPRPSPSTVRPSFYASRGYLFFIPDIVYQIGYPGKSAYDCIVPGVLSLIEKGFVDQNKIGIQGQSWGGYQVAYLVTRTNLFAAGMAGAPVSDMFSAYGGIRWGSGMSRMFQYEHTQSRIGDTIWDRPWHYIENSPVFRVPDVTTPLLIMHNDNDGAVPWYQGIEMFVAMRRLGKPAWLLNYNGEEHNLVKRQNRKDLSIRMQQFFDHYLKDEPAPVWMESGVPATQKGKDWGFELVK